MLPPFLVPLSTANLKHTSPTALNTIFKHKRPLDGAHTHWWPPKGGALDPQTVVLFVPGNPGLIEFYTPFLDALHSNSASQQLAILAHAHIDHSPAVTKSRGADNSLTVQVQGAIEAFDALRTTYPKETKVVIIGHSVGAWLCSQVLKARPDGVTAAFMLFPTLSNIVDTPNGRRLWPIFTSPARWVISNLGYIGRMLPMQLLALLFPEWPSSQLSVLQDLVGSPECISASLRMAHDEMNTIKDLDLALLESCKKKLRFYYASRDDWVGDERDGLLRALHSVEDGVPVTVVHDEHGIPHAFCINHGDQLAEQCLKWLDGI